jgi:hypothetical protein
VTTKKALEYLRVDSSEGPGTGTAAGGKKSDEQLRIADTEGGRSRVRMTKPAQVVTYQQLLAVSAVYALAC